MIEPYFADDHTTVYLGDCREVLAGLPDASIDAIVTDPPYGLEFMGKEWDSFGIRGKQPKIGAPDGSKFRQNMGTPSFTGSGNPTCRSCGGDKYRNGPRKCTCAQPDFGNPAATQMRAFQEWCEQWATECLRILKPGGYLIAFGGTRTWHRLVCAIEDAGFEIRDSTAALTGQDAPGLIWTYGSGFPKSLDVGKAIDKAAGATREVVGQYVPPNGKAWNLAADKSVPGYSGGLGLRSASMAITAPATEDAARWEGWGTALKPAWEPIAVARKPLVGTVAGNVTAYGTGALNIDGCRVALNGEPPPTGSGDRRGGVIYAQDEWTRTQMANDGNVTPAAGRWPTNVVLTHSATCGETCAADCPVAELDRQSGVTKSSGGMRGGRIGVNGVFGEFEHNGPRANAGGLGDTGGASRFFPVFRYQAKAPTSERPKVDGVAHETVKPLALMRWLVRLVTPPGGTVLDPFLGSGTTAEACLIEGFRCVGVERDERYLPLIKARLDRHQQGVLGFEESA